jgi:hypothetical protein
LPERFKVRRADAHALDVRAERFKDVVAPAYEHGALVHGLTPAWYSPERLAVIARAVKNPLAEPGQPRDLENYAAGRRSAAMSTERPRHGELAAAISKHGRAGVRAHDRPRPHKGKNHAQPQRRVRRTPRHPTRGEQTLANAGEGNASDYSSFITGAVWDVNGGQEM